MSSARKFIPAKTLRHRVIACCLVGLMGFLASANAADPRIDRIVKTNIINQPQVEIHFSSDANRTYYLQAIKSLDCNGCKSNNLVLTNWSNIGTGYSLPFTNHWIFYDGRTNKNRFYRLRVTTP